MRIFTNDKNHKVPTTHSFDPDFQFSDQVSNVECTWKRKQLFGKEPEKFTWQLHQICSFIAH